jgi:hypothetical protein
MTIPPNTELGNFTHWVVYTRSSLVEQTTPEANLIYDVNATPYDIRFYSLTCLSRSPFVRNFDSQ